MATTGSRVARAAGACWDCGDPGHFRGSERCPSSRKNLEDETKKAMAAMTEQIEKQGAALSRLLEGPDGGAPRNRHGKRTARPP